MKRVMILAAGVLCLTASEVLAAETVCSPDGRNVIRLYQKPLAFDVSRDGVTLVGKTEIALGVNGQTLAGGIAKVSTLSASGCEASPVYKKGKIDLSRHEAYADFGTWGVRLVARNDGVAWRFELTQPGCTTVTCERANVVIPKPGVTCTAHFTTRSGCEEACAKEMSLVGAQALLTKGRQIYLPFVYSIGGKTVAVTESDVKDYPIWNFGEGSVADDGSVCFSGTFEGFPSATYRAGGWDKGKAIPAGGRWVCVKDHAAYLTAGCGVRTLPWRVFVLADEPSKLVEADIVRALARPAKVGADFSWVKPGKVAWDWWNDWNLENVPFKAGCNTKTYEKYIDFASKHGVEYVIFDEGWSEELNIWKFHPDVDVPHLIQYAKARGVGIILWMAWAQVAGDEARVAEHFGKLGAVGFKVDFMDRGDADVESFLWKFADECAKRKLMVDYHGAHRPTGLSRTYPNVINYEGVFGLEQMKFYGGQDILANDVAIVFTRMTAGPMDYTPGAMLNFPIGKYPTVSEDKNRVFNHNPGSLGTRARQMAMMALYEAPLQMLCDSPSKYMRNEECFAFMAATPVTWDDTVGLGGEPSHYVTIARRKGDVWYVAGITDRSARDVCFDTAFLGAGNWTAEIFRDADDAAVKPEHYVHETKPVKAGMRMCVKLAPGGGFVMKVRK